MAGTRTTRWIRTGCVTGAALAAALAGGAAAAPAGVTGTIVGAKGATVLALARDGSAVAAKVGAGGRFTLRIAATRARGARLQLVGASGSYVGPVVLRRAGAKGYMALSGKRVNLGRVVVAKGFGRVVTAVKGADDGVTVARLAKNGRPLGAGRLGLTATTASTAGLPSASLAAVPGSGGGTGGGGGGGGGSTFGGGGSAPTGGADEDRDGIPSSFDADDDGDGTLDTVDPESAASNRGLFSTLYLPFQRALNANATGVTPEAIDQVVSGEGAFALSFFFDDGYAGGRAVTGGHVDCGGLPYCARGTGGALLSGGFMNPDGTAALPSGIRWADFNLDGSGYPNLGRVSSSDGRPSWAAGIWPKVGVSQLRAGDTYTVVFDTSAGPLTVPTALSPYFVTTPALASWGTGGTATPVSYPVAGDAPGTDSSPIAVGGPLTLTFWRPQRSAVPGAETGTMMDMGHLHYGLVLGSPNGGREFGCPDQISALSSTLSRIPSTSDPATTLTPLVDSAGDAPPDASRTMSFTVDVAGCLAANGVPATGTVRATLTAASESRPGGMDRAALTISLRLP